MDRVPHDVETLETETAADTPQEYLMATPSQVATGHKQTVSVKAVKVYVYGKLKFSLHYGGKHDRRFKIQWMKQELAAVPADSGSPNEDVS